MLRMLEVVGTSPLGFSEAVRAAVDEIGKAVREGRIKEYQVVLKVAVEAKEEFI
jgi:flavin-binding protein dodecin